MHEYVFRQRYAAEPARLLPSARHIICARGEDYAQQSAGALLSLYCWIISRHICFCLMAAYSRTAYSSITRCLLCCRCCWLCCCATNRRYHLCYGALPLNSINTRMLARCVFMAIWRAFEYIIIFTSEPSSLWLYINTLSALSLCRAPVCRHFTPCYIHQITSSTHHQYMSLRRRLSS